MRRPVVRGLLLAAGALGSAALLISQDFKLPQIPENTLKSEPILRAMRDELERSRQLAAVGGQDAPYFISYTLSDSESIHISSTLGATVNSQRNKFRAPQVEVRVGNYQSDNTGHINSGAYSGSRFDGAWPLDDNYENLRDGFWLATDRAFKTALESMGRKRAALRNSAAQVDPLPDFSLAPPVVNIPKLAKNEIDERTWTTRTNRLSAIFRNYPEALSSNVEMQIIEGLTYFMTTEGAALRYPDGIAWVYGKAEGQASDGMVVHDAVSVQTLEAKQFPNDEALRKEFVAVAENVRALSKAPAGEEYSGPALFEPQAAAQLLAQLLGDNLRVPRRPVTNPGSPVNMLPSELESRLGARILPDFIDVTDESGLATWNGKPLAGYYPYDMEGVPPQTVSVVEKGVLKSFLTTRQPVKGFAESNGHARLPGPYGTRAAAAGNLFIKATESKPLEELKRQLIAEITQRQRPYGILVRKLDYPYSGTGGELQALAQASAQGGGSPRPVAPPVLVYRVFPDGREELVRGLRFRGVNVRTLRDILAASTETALFDYVNTTAPLALLGSGGYLAPTSVVAPGLLFDEIEFEVPREQLPKPPTVPPPPDNL